MYKTLAHFHTLYRGIGGERERAPCQTTGRFSLAPFLNGTRKERGTMILEGFFSGLEAQSEITDLLDILYGSFGELLIATYKLAS